VGHHVGRELAPVVEPLASTFDVFGLVGADRHRLVGDLRQLEQRRLQFGLQLLGARLDLVQLGFELL